MRAALRSNGYLRAQKETVAFGVTLFASLNAVIRPFVALDVWCLVGAGIAAANVALYVAFLRHAAAVRPVSAADRKPPIEDIRSTTGGTGEGRRGLLDRLNARMTAVFGDPPTRPNDLRSNLIAGVFELEVVGVVVFAAIRAG
ncbi:MAG: hypothetical protein LBG11_02465 [Bifidobacteriaceae bacterium]|nr:hypothetical protein [Bifidobacteriaceae bacterium]